MSRGVRQARMPIVSICHSSLCKNLGSAVGNDIEIRGFKVLDTENKIPQYANDTTFRNLNY